MTEKAVTGMRKKLPSIERLEFDVATLAERMRDGSIEKRDAEIVLLYFCAASSRDRTIESGVIEALAAAFTRYLDGTSRSLDKAFGLIRLRAGNPGTGSGKRRLKNDDERRALALQVADLMDGGARFEAAIEAVRNEAGVSKNTAEKCYREHCDRIAEYVDELIRCGTDEDMAIDKAVHVFNVSSKCATRAVKKRKGT